MFGLAKVDLSYNPSSFETNRNQRERYDKHIWLKGNSLNVLKESHVFEQLRWEVQGLKSWSKSISNLI